MTHAVVRHEEKEEGDKALAGSNLPGESGGVCEVWKEVIVAQVLAGVRVVLNCCSGARQVI